MTDKQLEEYTRLKIEEATRELEAQKEMFQNTIIELEKDKGIKQYRYTLLNNFSKLPNAIDKIVYLGETELSKEMKVLHEYNIKYLEEKEKYLNDNLFNRLKKAIRGKL